ncbi:redoxin domain-containing protein [Prosthecobacter vanneervenii]|uniref:Peroxiredoxin n=1 Tax=Prosthecobacter vanneervenii TaxID=48466 RepID=A0A7W7YFG1_9BACT|nr:redoxin domain-containing protein [Prosthecobacter vanneervenii]MBB5034905.1 peroxiredoxin [Prosthecobacter vanneervenii]
MKPFMLSLCLLSLASAPAEEVRLEWMSTGMYYKVHYHSPTVTRFLQEKPAEIVKVPEGLVSPQYVLLETGPKKQRKLLGLILDQRSPKEAHMWLDANGDGDLTNDPKVKWESAVRGPEDRKIISWHGEASVQIKYPDGTRDMGLAFYRNGSSSGPGPLIYRRDYGRSGKVSISGREVDIYLSDDSTTGEFTPERSSLCIDVNADGRIETRSELFQFRKPLVIQGSVFEARSLSPDGSRFELVASSQSAAQVAEQKQSQASAQMTVQRKAQEADLGKPAPAFEAKTLDGKMVRFPEDYKGRLVMLDFWATWCGPCLNEMPGLRKVHDEFAEHGFAVLGVSLDQDETAAGLPEFLQSHGMRWPQICDGKGWQADIARQYGVRGIPSCWLIDGDTGRIVATSVDLRGEALHGTVKHALANLGREIKTGTPSAEPKTTSDAPSSPLTAKVQKLAAEDGVISAGAFLSALAHPKADSLELIPPGSTSLRGREIAKRAAAAHLRVGWVYQCTKCDRWHTALSGGYAIAPDTVVTARHVVAPPASMKPGSGHPVVVRGELEVLKISSVVFADEAGDTAILRVAAKDLQPLPLSHDVQAGDTAYCFSDPRDVLGHFSSGMVNRLHGPAMTDTPASPLQQRMDVSADWAPGSSGSAILDEFGNVIGHVARIRPLYGNPQASPSGSRAPATALMTLNEAVPASVVLALIEKKK